MDQKNLQEGDVVDAAGRYAVVRELGRGGMATVYLVNDNSPGVGQPASVALKVLHSDQSAHERGRQRFVREFELLSIITHPNVIRVFEQGEAQSGAPFFTMEHVAGRTLKDLIAERGLQGQVPLPQVLGILLQVGKALCAAHAAGVLYCDLKPSNILLQEQDGGVDVRLVDFGIAQSSVVHGSGEALTDASGSAGALTGTTLYMSPEQVRGVPLAVTSDIYSFGVVAFELCCGVVPFQQEGLFAVTASHLIGKVPEVRRVNPETPASIERMIMVCLSKEPSERYASMVDIVDRVRRAQAQRDAPKGLAGVVSWVRGVLAGK